MPTLLGYVQYLRRIAEVEERTIDALRDLATPRTGGVGCYVLLEVLSSCPWRDRAFFQTLEEGELYEDGLMA